MKLFWTKSLLTVWCLYSSTTPCNAADEYSEELVVQPLGNSRVILRGTFTVETATDHTYDFDLFPKPIGSILNGMPHLSELSLSLSKGRGLIPDSLLHSSPPHIGADLRTIWRTQNGTDIGKSDSVLLWQSFERLRQVLSAMYCGSLSSEDMMPSVLQSDDRCANSNGPVTCIRQVLVGEPLCTENLTPWRKLICAQPTAEAHTGRLTGLLLNPHFLFSSEYHALTVEVQRDVCTQMPDNAKTNDISQNRTYKNAQNECANCRRVTRFQQTVHSIVSVSDYKSQFKTQPRTVWDILLMEVATKNKSDILVNKPPFARVSEIVIRDFNGKPLIRRTLPVLAGAKLDGGLTLPSVFKKQLVAERATFNGENIGEEMAFTLKRYVSHLTLLNAKYHFELCPVSAQTTANGSWNVTVFEYWPSFVKLFVHTLKQVPSSAQPSDSCRIEVSTLSPTALGTFEQFANERLYDDVALSGLRVGMRVAVDSCQLAAGQCLAYTMQLEKRLLTTEEYPADYNRGFDIPSAIVAITGTGANGRPLRRHLVSRPLLLVLPFPDMSMVFNVIAFSSTLFAFFFGTVFNNLYRNVHELDKRNFHKILAWLKKFYKSKLKGRIDKWKAKVKSD